MFEQQQNKQIRIQDPYEDEIDLMDYVKVIFKRKFLIFGIFFLSILFAGAFSFSMPKVYEIDAILEIGCIEDEKTQKIELIEQPVQLVEKINNDIYGVATRDKLQITKAEYVKIKTENPKNTNLVKLTIKSSDIEKSKNILQEINALILAEHQKIIENKKTLIQSNINSTQDKIQLKQSDIQNTKNKIIPLDSDIARIENKIKYCQSEQENLEKKVEAIEQTLVYEQTPGTQFALFDAKEKLEQKKQEIENLYLRINNLERNIQDLFIQVNSLEIAIKDLNTHINLLEAFLNNVKPSQVIKSVSASADPVSPRILLNIIIAGILGMFVAIFLAFLKEWWIREK